MILYLLKGVIIGVCLIQQEKMLAQLTLDDDTILVLVDNTNRIIDISSKQRGHLQTKCIYLRKSC